MMLAMMMMATSFYWCAVRIVHRAAKVTARVLAFVTVPSARAWGWTQGAPKWNIGIWQAAHFILSHIIPEFICDWMFTPGRGWTPLDPFIKRPRNPPDKGTAMTWITIYLSLLHSTVESLRWAYQAGAIDTLNNWVRDKILALGPTRLIYSNAVVMALLVFGGNTIVEDVHLSLEYSRYLHTNTYFRNKRSSFQRRKFSRQVKLL